MEPLGDGCECRATRAQILVMAAPGAPYSTDVGPTLSWCTASYYGLRRGVSRWQENQITMMYLMSQSPKAHGERGRGADVSRRPAWIDRAGAALVSTWMISGLLSLAVAWVLDESLGGMIVNGGVRSPEAGALWTGLAYVAQLGLPPVIAAAGLTSAFWLINHRRRRAAATAVSIVLSIVLYRERLTTGRWLVALGFGFPLIIGLSRVVLGVHTASVVAEQWVIGASIGLGIVWTYGVPESRPRRLEP